MSNTLLSEQKSFRVQNMLIASFARPWSNPFYTLGSFTDNMVRKDEGVIKYNNTKISKISPTK